MPIMIKLNSATATMSSRSVKARTKCGVRSAERGVRSSEKAAWGTSNIEHRTSNIERRVNLADVRDNFMGALCRWWNQDGRAIRSGGAGQAVGAPGDQPERARRTTR